MAHKQFYLILSLVMLLLPLIVACGGAAPSYAPAEERPAQEVAVAVVEQAAPAAEAKAAQDSAAEAEAAPAESNSNGVAAVSNRPNVYNRLIIKKAEVALLVENTDTAINRSLGIVTEYGGYVVSNRTWFQDEGKYATLTIGVPAEYFEEMLRRLKELAVTVSNETVSGQDVTDEFVDLESRLVNLEATAARIREFLAQAKTVEESLQVSNQLSAIEAEIEQVKGRMAYLKDRAAFSTITLQIAPHVLVPTPTPTPSPTPTATPEPWSAGRTFNQATTVTSSAAQTLFQTSVDVLIWMVVVILPFAAPVVLVIWITFKLVRRLAQRETAQRPS